MMKPGHRKKTLKRPTRPKKSGMLTLSSLPTLSFMTVTYSP